jgi:hypothetical protein
MIAWFSQTARVMRTQPLATCYTTKRRCCAYDRYRMLASRRGGTRAQTVKFRAKQGPLCGTVPRRRGETAKGELVHDAHVPRGHPSAKRRRVIRCGACAAHGQSS